MSIARSAGSLHRLLRPWGLFVLAVGLLAPAAGSPAEAVTPPSLRIYSVSDHVTLSRSSPRGLPGDLGILITPVGGDFELRAKKSTPGGPIELEQTDSSGATLRDLPDDFVDGWRGLARGLRLRLETTEGEVVARRAMTLCLNAWERQRVTDEGATEPRYPEFCSGFPFLQGMVWGIEDHWAIDAIRGGTGIRKRIPDGDYVLTAFFPNFLVNALGIAPADRSVTINVTLTTRRRGGREPALRTASGEPDRTRPAAPVPNDEDPDDWTLPDLQALPAWSIHARGSRRRNGRLGRDLLTFAATEWNAGPAPLVVEGFRRDGEDVMDAFQYFYQDGEPVGRDAAGTLEYDVEDGHNHWHFLQFVRYRLLNKDLTRVVRSHKESFCLVPTDHVDLTVDGAEFRPRLVGLGSACGRARSVWIRETLPAGWGDTYFQWVPGQAFNITRVPNGVYHIEVTVNPLGLLHETDVTNNTELREIRLRGRRGNRWVVVSPWYGIDA